jgi:hypothetical protein
MNQAVESLKQQGYCVLPLPQSIFDKFNLKKYLEGQIEFLNPTVTSMKVMGSFGAFGNPASFHHSEIRKLRNTIYAHMETMFAYAYPGKYMQCIPDRFSHRRTGTKPTPESWHQDVSVPAGEGTVYGGWVNLDKTESQFFSCIPGSHLQYLPTAAGFVKFNAEARAQFDAVRMPNGIQIPPGHCIVFNELLVHEIRAKEQMYDSFRLYLKYLITDTEVMPFGDKIIEALDDLAVPPYHVGRNKKGHTYTYPTMYGPSHVNFNNRLKLKIEDFSAQYVKPEFYEPPREGVFAGAVWVREVMPSLRSVGVDLSHFPRYDLVELEWYEPRLLGNGTGTAEDPIVL